MTSPALPPEPSRLRDQPLSSPARGQSGRLVPVGEEALERARAREPAHPLVHRLLRLPLVPRHGPRVVRGRGDGGSDEHPLRQHQGGPRGAPRSRQDLPGVAPVARAPPGRLAAHHVPHRGRPDALLRRHLLPAVAPPRPARVPRSPCAGGGLPRRPRRRDREAEPVASRRPRPGGAGRGGRCGHHDRRAPRAGHGGASQRLRRARRGLRRGAQVPASDEHRAVLPAPPRPARPPHGRAHPGEDGPSAGSTTTWAAGSAATRWTGSG